MNPERELRRRDRILGGLWGSLVGDALGVPVEFMDRTSVQCDPVIDMRGYGSHRQPPGTWSDDSSLLLCTVDSLLHHTFDTDDLGRRFVRWKEAEIWAPHDRVFDIGATTSEALSRVARGVRAKLAGGDAENSNGNGSLMRIIPISLRFTQAPLKDALDAVHRASAITHRHPRSQLACGLYTLLARELLQGASIPAAFESSVTQFRTFYETNLWWSLEFYAFEPILNGALADHHQNDISSGGYVIDTLTVSIWCLLTTSSFEECVLKAVNLGGDSDTTGCVAGGLAGVHYGMAEIRQSWIESLARTVEIKALFEQFVDLSLD